MSVTMLKKLILNRRTIPIPVPIRNLEEVLVWIDQTFRRGDQAVTKIMIDRKDITEAPTASLDFKKILFTAESHVEIQLESAAELSIQSLDTVRNLSLVLERGLKPCAVNCYQTMQAKVPTDIEPLQNDLVLIASLMSHFLDLVEIDRVHLKTFKEDHGTLEKIIVALKMAKANSDWKAYASILLNQLEPLIRQVIQEAGDLQGLIFALRTEQQRPATRY
jgi:hypothetical protein